MLRNGGNGYKAYVFRESTRRYAINRKGRGRKEVIYPCVADISCTRGVRESTGFSYGGPYGQVPWHKITIKNYYPLLLIGELINRLLGIKIFIKLDLKDIYH